MYNPLEILFHILSLARRGVSSGRALARQVRTRVLYDGTWEAAPGVAFWVKLAQQAGLMDEAFRPSLLLPAWFAMTEEARYLHLLEAWEALPAARRHREARGRLVARLAEGRALSPFEQRDLAGLRALKLVEGQALSALGQRVLSGEVGEVVRPLPWYVHGELLWVPYPPDYTLLWALEAFVDPVDPGVYALDARALRLARQRAESMAGTDVVAALPKVLARGLGIISEAETDFLGRLAYALDDQPSLSVAPGFLLSFSDPNELRRLRRVRRLRPYLDGVLSAHHVFLFQKQADPVLQWLAQRGQYAPDFPPNASDGPLTLADRAALLALYLFAEGAGAALALPPGLFSRLATPLNLPLRAAAVQKAWKAVETRFPRPAWVPEPEPPERPLTETLLWLEQAIAHQTPIDFLYQKAEGYRPETRHVTPLLIEQRGLRFYLIGYCHTRRANRMFRVDRMRWEGETG